MKYKPVQLRLVWPPPGKRQEVLELLERLDADLQAMVDAELAAGNFVVDATLGWLQPKGIAVLMHYEFQVAHAPPARVVFRAVDDPHWWKSEFFIEGTGDLLACSFKKKE